MRLMVPKPPLSLFPLYKTSFKMTTYHRSVPVDSMWGKEKEERLCLVPSPRAPPGEKWSGEQSRIPWAYSPKVVRTAKCFDRC